MNKKEFIKNLSLVKIIFGNGFDLFCGLNSKYSDYFNFRKDDYNSVFKWIESIKSDGNIITNSFIGEIGLNWKSLITTYSLNGEITFWDIYFCLKMKDKNRNRCDIEKEMLDLLCEEKSQNKLSNNIELISIFECINNKETSLLKNYSTDIVLACYIKAKILWEKEQRLLEFVYNELLKFETIFGEYILNECKTKKHQFDICFNSFLRSVIANNDNIVSIDTFNYSVVNLANNKDLISKINHINGDLNEPIFGVDSSSISPGSDMYIFTKTARRLNSKAFSDELYFNVMDGGFKNLIIFGHSLNKQDYNYFFPVFNYLKINEISYDSVLVFLYYVYDKKRKEEIKKDYILRIAKLISEYDYYINNTKNGSRLFDILSSTNRIVIYEVDKPINCNYNNI